MNMPCQNFTSSNVTIKEIGTKLVSMRIQEPKSWMNNITLLCPSPFLGLLSYQYRTLSIFLTVKAVPVIAAIKARINWATRIIKMDLFMRLSKSDNFLLGFALFIITLVWCPVYTTTPYTKSVFLKLLPFSMRLSTFMDSFSLLLPSSRAPSNL